MPESEPLFETSLPYFPNIYPNGPSVTEEVLFTLAELVDINLNSGWTDISNNVFMNVKGLLKITIPYTVTTIGMRAFKNAVDLSSVVFNNMDIGSTENSFELTSIGDEAFQNTFKLTQLRIPDSVTTIGANVFKGSGLTSITFDASSAIVNLTASTFEGATALSEIIFLGTTNYTTSNGVLYTSDMTKLVMYYSKDTSVTSFTVPSTVTHIEDGAFQYSTHLTEILFEDGGIQLTTIGSNAFRGLSQLTSFTIPSSVTSIGTDAFRGLSSLSAFTVVDGNAFLSTDADGVLFNQNKTTLIQYPLGKTAQSYTIPNTVQIINERALEYAKVIAFSVEDGSTSFIHDTAGVLYNNTYTTLIQFPLNNTMTTYAINRDVTSIYKGAFNDANNLDVLELSLAVSNIVDVEFKNMTNLREIKSFKPVGFFTYVVSPNPRINTQKQLYVTVRNGILYNAIQTILIKYPCKNATSSFRTDDSVSVIKSGAFSNATNLIYIDSNRVVTIEPEAFINCTSLRGIDFRVSIRNIGNNAFEGAFDSNASSNVIIFASDDGLTIGEDAFKNSALTKATYNDSYNLNPELYRNSPNISNNIVGFYGKPDVTIDIITKHFRPYNMNSPTPVLWPSTDLIFNAQSVRIQNYNTIAKNAFKSATGIRVVNFRDNDVRRIQEGAFQDCTNLITLTIPPRVRYINYNVFKGTTQLSSITLHDGITSIGVQAFENSGITNITFSKTLTEIGKGAFMNCTNLQSLLIPPSVTNIESDAFIDCTGLQTVTFEETTNLDSLQLDNGDGTFTTLTAGTGKEFYGATNVTIAVNTHVYDVSEYNIVDGFIPRQATTLRLLWAPTTITTYFNTQFLTGNYTTLLIDYTIIATNILTLFSFRLPNLTNIILSDSNVPYAIGRLLISGTVLSGIPLPTIGYSRVLYGEITTNNFYGGILNYTSMKIDTSRLLVNSLQSNWVQYLLTTLPGDDRYKKTLATEVVLQDIGSTNPSNPFQFIDTKNTDAVRIRRNIRKVTITGQITEISNLTRVFPNLEEVVFDNAVGLHTLGNFCIGSRQTSITIPSSVNVISSGFAYNSPNLTTVTFESSVNLNVLGVTPGLKQNFFGASNVDIYVNTWVFRGEGELTGAYENFNSEFDRAENAVVYDYTTIGVSAFQFAFKMKTISLPDSITIIGANAFANSGIINIDIPRNVVSIGNRAFNFSLDWQFTGRGSITFPDSSILETIGDYAFEYTNIRSIRIPATVRRIGEGAFSNNTLLSSVTFVNGSRITTITKKMFLLCANLTSIIIPADVTSIEDEAFSYCSNLSSVTFAPGSKLRSVGFKAFYYCEALTSISFPLSLTSIGAYAFANTGLRSLYFPSDMLCTIGHYAFGYLPHPLTEVTFQPPMSDISMDRSDIGGRNGGFVFIDTVIEKLNMTTYDVEYFDLSLSYITDSSYVTGFFGASGEALFNDTTPSNTPICFPSGTPVRTNLGDVAIDKLDPDIHTIRDKRIVAITQSQPLHTYIVNIEKNALAVNVPSNTTRISKEHKVYYKGQMVKAKDLIKLCKGVTKIPYTGEILYNVLMEQHDKMMINNLICETLHPENIMAKIHNGNYNTQEKKKMYAKLSKLIENGDMVEYNKFYKSI